MLPRVTGEEIPMRWVLIVIAAIVLLPIVWKLLIFATGLAIGLLQLAITLAVVAAVAIFIVGLVRRMLVMR
jgi:hypothetical protein